MLLFEFDRCVTAPRQPYPTWLQRFGALALASLLITACDGTSAVDAGVGDAASPLDAQAPDAQFPDAQFPDAQVLDAGVIEPADGGPIATAPATAADVEEAPGAGPGPFGDPAAATNGVRGAGDEGGGTDVFSIGYGEHLVLSWGGRRVRNGPGVDFAVFENAFHYGAGSTFMDPIVVEVSIDASTWVALPHDYVAADEHTYAPLTSAWVGFAGVTPVRLHAESNPVDPFDAAAAGGDHFDLDSLSPEGEAGRIRRTGFVYLRLSPAHDHDNPDTGEPFPRDGVSNGPDVDGVAARYVDAS